MCLAGRMARHKVEAPKKYLNASTKACPQIKAQTLILESAAVTDFQHSNPSHLQEICLSLHLPPLQLHPKPLFHTTPVYNVCQYPSLASLYGVLYCANYLGLSPPRLSQLRGLPTTYQLARRGTRMYITGLRLPHHPRLATRFLGGQMAETDKLCAGRVRGQSGGDVAGRHHRDTGR